MCDWELKRSRVFYIKSQSVPQVGINKQKIPQRKIEPTTRRARCPCACLLAHQ